MADNVVDKSERTWALFAHLSSFVIWVTGIPFANIIAPLIIWQIKKDDMPFAAEQAKECLNFQISLTIYAVISGILTLVVIGIFALIAIMIVHVVFTILAALKANEGIGYVYPITIRLVT